MRLSSGVQALLGFVTVGAFSLSSSRNFVLAQDEACDNIGKREKYACMSVCRIQKVIPPSSVPVSSSSCHVNNNLFFAFFIKTNKQTLFVFYTYISVDVACSMDSFSILCAALQNAPAVADALSEGPWTIFAPTNDALNELGEEILTMILEDEDVLNNILLFHAVPDIVSSEELVCTNKIEMANGQDSRTVCRSGKKHQKGGSNARNDMPAIITTDIETCQGLIHIIGTYFLYCVFIYMQEQDMRS